MIVANFNIGTRLAMGVTSFETHNRCFNPELPGMSETSYTLTDAEIQLLEKHLPFYLALDREERQPASDAQSRFVLVCRGLARAETPHELAYAKYRMMNAAQRIAMLNALEKEQRSRTTAIEEGYPDPNWSPTMHYNSDPYYADRRFPGG